MKENVILDKSIHFSLSVIQLYKKLIAANEFVMSKQLLRSATSIGANIHEAQAGVSKRDFANKMAIASKEAREVKYWLVLLDKSQYIEMDYTKYMNDVTELIKMLTAIVKTAQSTIKH
ncbi:MAG: four helix bundle protein [Cyclobacteriaceae bacterium]